MPSWLVGPDADFGIADCDLAGAPAAKYVALGTAAAETIAAAERVV
jgi:hypothetical protein